jgi:hypothetical protein
MGLLCGPFLDMYTLISMYHNYALLVGQYELIKRAVRATKESVHSANYTKFI